MASTDGSHCSSRCASDDLECSDPDSNFGGYSEMIRSSGCSGNDSSTQKSSQTADPSLQAALEDPGSATDSQQGEPDKDGGSVLGALSGFLSTITNGLSQRWSKLLHPHPTKQLLGEVSVRGLAEYILGGQCRKIIVLAGAGISTSAGIPDFRSPKTGFYDCVAKYRLPFPQAIFTSVYFKRNPEPFFEVARTHLLRDYQPTPAHYFIRLLDQNGLLLRCYTQNVDGLEFSAGVDPSRVVQAHGTYKTSHCTGCQRLYTFEQAKEKITSGKVPRCDDCGSVIKPDIVLFGDYLPASFFRLSPRDFPACDLLIVMGTSLKVHPFAGLQSQVSLETPRVLINRECVGSFSRSSVRDVLMLGNCDEAVKELAAALGWTDQLDTLIGKSGPCESVP